MTDVARVHSHPQRVAIAQTVQHAVARSTPHRVGVEQVVHAVAVHANPHRANVRAGGPRGRAGGSFYEHSQSAPSAIWTINHNLGFRPTVELRTAGGQEFIADVQHPTVNQVVVYLNSPLAGFARLI